MVKKNSSRILIIEDSPSQAAVIADVVRQAGHTPIVYTELPTGVSQILLKEQPDLVLLDLKLLDENGDAVADGFQICREIKRSPLKPPVVVITAEGEDEASEWAILQGADAFIQKPFAMADLTQAISTVLPKSEAD